MQLNEPYNTTVAPRRGGRGFNNTNNSNSHRSGEREVPLGMVIDRTSRLHIANIPLDVLEAEGNDALKADFAAFGHIDRYVLFCDRTGRFTGSGMATFRNPADAREAMKALNKRPNSDGTVLKVSLAEEHGVVLMKDLKQQRWERQAARARGELGEGGEGEDDEEVLDEVEAARLEKMRRRKGFNPDGSWSHDGFDRMQRGENVRPRGGYRGPDREGGRGGGGGGRGGGGGGGRGAAPSYFQRVENRFEQYIQERDGGAALLGAPPMMGTAGMGSMPMMGADVEAPILGGVAESVLAAPPPPPMTMTMTMGLGMQQQAFAVPALASEAAIFAPPPPSVLGGPQPQGGAEAVFSAPPNSVVAMAVAGFEHGAADGATSQVVFAGQSDVNAYSEGGL